MEDQAVLLHTQQACYYQSKQIVFTVIWFSTLFEYVSNIRKILDFFYKYIFSIHILRYPRIAEVWIHVLVCIEPFLPTHFTCIAFDFCLSYLLVLFNFLLVETANVFGYKMIGFFFSLTGFLHCIMQKDLRAIEF